VIEQVARILRLFDRSEQPVFAFDEIQRWPTDLLDRLVSIGLLHEIEPAELIACNNCDEGHVLEPDICAYPDIGEVAVAKCPTCGRVQFSLDRLRQWGVHGDGLANHLANAITAGKATVLVPQRCWRLGPLYRDGVYREVFLARGLTWPDAGDVVAQSERLAACTVPALLVPADIPEVEQWPKVVPATAALTEIATLTAAGLVVDWDRLVQIPITAARGAGTSVTDPDSEAALRAIVLTDVEGSVLKALARKPNKAFGRDELVDASGYGKEATRNAVDRLIELGLAARPPGTRRKGVAITPRGLRYVEMIQTDGHPG